MNPAYFCVGIIIGQSSCEVLVDIEATGVRVWEKERVKGRRETKILYSEKGGVACFVGSQAKPSQASTAIPTSQNKKINTNRETRTGPSRHHDGFRNVIFRRLFDGGIGHD